jgi:hypothetical protein
MAADIVEIDYKVWTEGFFAWCTRLVIGCGDHWFAQ